jgi:hypothetical protein
MTTATCLRRQSMHAETVEEKAKWLHQPMVDAAEQERISVRRDTSVSGISNGDAECPWPSRSDGARAHG